jgi:hypothetical protein
VKTSLHSWKVKVEATLGREHTPMRRRPTNATQPSIMQAPPANQETNKFNYTCSETDSLGEALFVREKSIT